MQSENFDNEIRNSLSQRPPGNDKPEWDKMETLLNKHMPVEKKDRRRVIFILFLFLLLGGGAFLIWKNNSNNDHDIVANKPGTGNSTSDNKSNPTNNSTGKTDNKINPTTTESPKNSSSETSLAPKKEQSTTDNYIKITPSNAVQPLPGKEIEIKVSELNISKKKPQSKPVQSQKGTVKNRKSEKQLSNKIVTNTNADKTVIDEPANITTAPGIKSDEEKNKEVEAIKPIEDNTQANQKVAENKIEEQKQKPEESQLKLTANTKSQKQKNGSSFLSNFFFSVSAGPDFSSVGLSETGKVQPVFGAGIGYNISKKLSVRTGFYTARKIYTADPEDYHPPYNFWTYYPNLKTIDANCKVYEIPVVVDYTVSQNKKRSWFVSAGLSSLLMKRETYDYYYKPNSSPTYISYTRTFVDQNKHYFSVLDLSGGYTRRINKNFSLRAEPYAKFALSGVGYGKVKLNSGGVLFSAIITPFARK